MTVDSQPAQPQSLYDAVGGEPTFRRIVARFYDARLTRPHEQLWNHLETVALNLTTHASPSRRRQT